jgi:hypothetical protein
MERAQKRAIAIYLFGDMFLLLARMVHVLVLRERSQRKTTEKTTRSGEENTPFSLIVQSIGQAKEEVGWFHLLLLGGAFTHTHTHTQCGASTSSSLPFFSFFYPRPCVPVLWRCKWQVGPHSATVHSIVRTRRPRDPPPPSSSFSPKQKNHKKIHLDKSRFPFFFSCWFHRQQVFCLFVLGCCVNQHLCDAQHKSESKLKENGDLKEEDNRVIFIEKKDQHYQRPIP